MQPPEGHIAIATARLQDGLYTCVSLYTLPHGSLNDILDAFEAQGPWDEKNVFSALCAGLECGAALGGGISEGKIDDILTEKPTIGPALWFMRHMNHGHFTFPPEMGIFVAADEVGDGVIFEPISDDFLAWAQRQARLEEMGRTVH